MTIAVFDYQSWAARYPELAPTTSAALATALFVEAGAYLNNTDASPVCDVAMRGVYLNMLVAHLAALQNAQLVGRISSASEGSVSVSSEYAVPGSAAWYAQTKYGAAFWAATASFRVMIYTAPPPPNFAPGLLGRRALWPF